MKTRLIDQEVVKRLIKALDLGVLGFLALAATTIYAPPRAGMEQFTAYYLVLTLVLGSMLTMRALGLYDLQYCRRPTIAAIKSAAITSGAGLACVALSRVLPAQLNFVWWAVWTGTATVCIFATRFAAAAWLSKAFNLGRFHRRIAIVGGGEPADRALELLEQGPQDSVEIVGLFDDRFDIRSPVSLGQHRKLGTIAELRDYARSSRIDLIIVAIPMSAEKRLLHILKQLWELPVDIRISAASSELKLSAKAYSYLGRLPLLSVFDRPLSGWDNFLKACLDRTLAAILLVLLAPVFVCVALAIKLDSKGPVFFRQKRFGFNNEMVDVFKFRSLHIDQSDANATKLVTKNDKRVTRVGRFIRKSSLDELPQLVNVLRGDLSLVGPRPHAKEAKAADALYEQVVDGYFARHRVKPGITGWAQINGWRGETDTFEKVQQRVKHDLEYIDTWSLGLDLYILLKTPFSLLKSENAY
jgi:Undecaprenyl-phosphate glucose phosphotransferase